MTDRLSKVISVLLSIACLQACAEDLAAKSPIEASVTFTQSSDELLIAAVELSASVTIENIQIRKDGHLNDWVIEFRSAADLQVLSASSGIEERNFRLDDASYTQLLEALIVGLSNEYPHLKISRIQLDLELVASTWNAIVASLKQEAQKLTGNVAQMSKPISSAIVQTIASSNQVEVSCRLIESTGVSCRENPISMNPVAFRPDLVGTPWNSLVEYSDGGLQSGAWFTIRIQ